ncbi:colanic acid biosynthesis acetyltransferase WcaF [Polynucleobacter wuianus]|uniref:Colanic acid biosynthesis acetyltransferase WcaF n=1 Tax=Polynucleobacter wuianus TaxID=1743168 RepID=A0A191UF65_9BURK|nr:MULTISPECIES: WcaF family extracellular polysaccharide biosynthesis acetyltransferase [Polynucleobacter]ANI99678.1 colanic acid biosynthesis acetyltransferase WcaF [Polynucleobacter wuianus]MBU3553930.1 colanic acid biosynthesis acetyltransferase WcaF [Polynucleobacter sp. MWH-Post4-6-1]MBU3611235.1 colanic acid biosynthesis acetyltransferase WcaF [Polynucleobacter wuianus]
MRDPIYQDLSQFSMPPNFRGKNVFIVQLWWIVQALLFSTSPDFLYGYRAWLLRLFGAKLGNNVRIRPSAKVTFPWKLEVGDNVWIGYDTIIYNLEKITIGSNVAIAHRVYLCTGSHNISKLTFDIESYPINIEDEVWLPNDIFVGPGVTIGHGTVVAARSTVLKDLESGIVAVGSPARKLRNRLPA